MESKFVAEILGYVASGIGTVVFLPQVIQIWKTKRAQDVSLLSYSLIFFGTILWIVYGLLISAGPVIVCNSVIFVLSLTIIVLKLKYSKVPAAK